MVDTYLLDSTFQRIQPNSIVVTPPGGAQGTIGSLLAAPVVSATNGVTAAAGGGQTNAVLITTALTRVTTVATAADSVKLPASFPGASYVVINAAAANSLNIFPASGDTINALGANTAYALAATKIVTFWCAVAGTWNTDLTG